MLETPPLQPAPAVDLERITRRFSERFKTEHAAFLAAIQGIPGREARARYASLLLYRLTFTRFLQQKGVPADTIARLFERHQIEQDAPAMAIPNEAFARLFAFFDAYHWHLDERPPRDEQEITPAVLSAVFEQHINQRQMGAYYTREDVTNYISKNTIIPALFELAQEQCPAAFQLDGEVWRLLRNDPNRYIYQEVLKGIDLPLPQEIAAGISTPHPPTPSAQVERESAEIRPFSPSPQVERAGVRPLAVSRQPWNRPADPAYALPTETWREVVARRTRCQETRAKLASGALTHITDLITHNLDIQRFAQDVIERCQSPELLRAFWHALEHITVLDPTCGSGAFLFAALRILEPLYDACLNRMQAFLEGASVPPVFQPAEGRGVPPASPPAGVGACTAGWGRVAQTLAGFREVLARAAQPPNRRAFILTSIITNNLYGVDIMPEAVEIVRLRLFLTLVAQVEDARNLEPPPALARNIRVGNTLVGYATADEGQHASASTSDALDRALARAYGIEPAGSDAFTRWRASHQPFHWFAEFHDIVQRRGGFNVILGNPPYVEYYEGTFPYRLPPYQTLPCGNLYPCVVERSHALLRKSGYFGMILPLAAFATRNMIPLIEGVRAWFPQSWLSFYHFRPSMLFSGGKVASIPTSILLARADGTPQRFSTGVLKWHTQARDLLFPTLAYQQITAPPDAANRHYSPKFGAPIENSIMQKLLHHRPISQYLASVPNANSMYYRSAGGLYWKVFINFPWPYQTTSNKRCSFDFAYDRDIFVALFNSSLFWWYYTVTFDTFNLKDYLLFGFRCTYPADAALLAQLKACTQRLMDDYRANAEHLKRGATGSYTIYARKSKPIIDEIDRLLARQYGFTAEELDFILNYDLKYRMGQDL